MSANLFISVFIIFMAHFALSGLVPRTQDDNVQLEPIDENKYYLRINHADGSVREETVQIIPPEGEIQLMGVLKQNYPVEGGRLVVTYEAGRNGYIAKYSYVTDKGHVEPVILSLSPSVLKATVG